MVEDTYKKELIIFSLIVLCITMIILISCSNPSLDEPPKPFPIKKAIAFPPGQIWRGINLGGALEAPNPGEWGVTIEASYLKEIREAGFNCVRIPVRFSAHASEHPPYLLDSDFMKEVEEVVNLSLQEGLTVFLDLHHYDQMMTDPLNHQERFLAIWDQIATHFQSFPKNLMFELLNEPSNHLDSDTWNQLAIQAIKRIRNSNPDRKILIGGTNYNQIETLELIEIPDDGNLIATFHFYQPFAFTHQGASWVQGSNSWEGTKWQGTPEEKHVIQDQLDQAAEWSSMHQIPLIMGEFGVIKNADAGSRDRWISFVVQEAEKRGISWIYWDFCGDFGIYDCNQKSWTVDLGSFVLSDH